MVPITEEEKNGPLYKYFIRDMVEPDPAKYAQTQDPVDFPEEESPLHLDNLFEPGYMPIELGYGYLPDGYGRYVRLLVCMAPDRIHALQDLEP